jgi:hypothetical protein
MPRTLAGVFAERLVRHSHGARTVKEAEDGERVFPDRVWMAPAAGT